MSHALILSLIGDLMFIFNPDQYAFPILFFSLSHMAYAMRAGARQHYVMYCCLLLLGVLLSMNNFKVQVVLYSVIMLSSFIVNRHISHYFVGYGLFILSDILLAYRDFVCPYPGDDLLALTTYFFAQIVLSGPKRSWDTQRTWTWTWTWTWSWSTWDWTILDIPWVPL